MSSYFPSRRRPFDLWVWFSYRHRWLGSRIRWRMIWAHLIFRPVTFSMSHWGVSPVSFEICRSPTDLHDQDSCPIHVFWYSHDSWTELSQARGFPLHPFSGVHVRSFVRPHGVTLELSGQIGCIWCHTGAYFPHLAMEAIVLSQILHSFHHSARICCICLTNCYSCDFVEMSFQWNTMFRFGFPHWLGLFSRLLCRDHGVSLTRLPSETIELSIWNDDRFFWQSIMS